VEDDAAFWWAKILELLAPLDPEWAAIAAARAISGDDFNKQRSASKILSEMAKTHPEIVMDVVGAELLNRERGWRWKIGSKREIISALPVDVVIQWLSKVGIAGARGIARHLPYLFLTADGTACVPELTERVLSEYGEDTTVFKEFSVGRHNLEVRWGSVSSHYEADAQIAKAFLNHPLLVIRRWAERTLASAKHYADKWKRREEDEDFES